MKKEAIKIPDFQTKKELFDFLVNNQERIIAQKKADIKHADGVPMLDGNVTVPIKKKVDKGTNYNEVKVKAVINTTNILDSHGDVHISGLWTKSIKESNMIMHIQEHKMEFDKIIADDTDLNVYTKNYTWKSLGFNWDGTTQALIFDSTVKRDRNEYMFEQYKQGRVKNHSVGMQYVKMVMAINDEDYGANYEAWEKYFPEIVNKDDALDRGYFWAVKEAKVIEGSAVPRGSNVATPTISVKDNHLESILKNIDSLLEAGSTPLDTADDDQINQFITLLNI